MPSSHLILCHPLLLLPPILPRIRVFSNESTLHIRWPKYWIFSFNISPSKEHLGLISFRMDWLDLLAVQGTLESLFLHHSSKASILRPSASFVVQLSHPYMTTGKNIALTRRTFVGKVMSLLLNVLSRLVITFLPRSKHLLIPWLQSPSTVILEAKKVKSATVSTVSPSISHEVILWVTTFICKIWVGKNKCFKKGGKKAVKKKVVHHVSKLTWCESTNYVQFKKYWKSTSHKYSSKKKKKKKVSHCFKGCFLFVLSESYWFADWWSSI